MNDDDPPAGSWICVATEGTTNTIFAGTYYTGREESVACHETLLKGPLEGSQLADQYLSWRLISDDVAIMTTRGDTYEGETPPHLSKVQIYTLVQNNDTWFVAAFQNTQWNPVMEQIP